MTDIENSKADQHDTKETPKTIDFRKIVERKLEAVQEAYYKKATKLHVARREAKEFLSILEPNTWQQKLFLDFANLDNEKKESLRSLLENTRKDGIQSLVKDIFLRDKNHFAVNHMNFSFPETGGLVKWIIKNTAPMVAEIKLWSKREEVGEVIVLHDNNTLDIEVEWNSTNHKHLKPGNHIGKNYFNKFSRGWIAEQILRAISDRESTVPINIEGKGLRIQSQVGGDSEILRNALPIFHLIFPNNRLDQAIAEISGNPKSSLKALTPDELWVYIANPDGDKSKSISKEEKEAAVAWGEEKGIAWGREAGINWEKEISIDWGEFPKTAKTMQVCLTRKGVAKELEESTAFHPDGVSKAMGRSSVGRAMGWIAEAFSGGPKEQLTAKTIDEILALHRTFSELENIRSNGEKLLRHPKGQKLGLELIARCKAIMSIVTDVVSKIEMSLELQSSAINLEATQSLILKSAVGGEGITQELAERIAVEEKEIDNLLRAASEVVNEDLGQAEHSK